MPGLIGGVGSAPLRGRKDGAGPRAARLGRTLPFVTRSEAQGVQRAVQNVDKLAIMSADEAPHWDDLHA